MYNWHIDTSILRYSWWIIWMPHGMTSIHRPNDRKTVMRGSVWPGGPWIPYYLQCTLHDCMSLIFRYKWLCWHNRPLSATKQSHSSSKTSSGEKPPTTCGSVPWKNRRNIHLPCTNSDVLGECTNEKKNTHLEMEKHTKIRCTYSSLGLKYMFIICGII